MRQIHSSAWLLVLLSAILQILIFPLPNLYPLSWIAVAPLLVALLRARPPQTLQLSESTKLIPANPGQAFLLGYSCGVLWYGGTCYWVYSTMRQYGGVSAPAATGILMLFCLYLGLYHGAFGLIIGLLAARDSAAKTQFSRRAVLLAPAVWVTVELARTRISGFPWDLLGIAEVDNVALTHSATIAGVYAVSFEIMLVNAAIAAIFLVRREKRRALFLAALVATVVLQAGSWIPAPTAGSDHLAVLLQQNVPVGGGQDWTREYFLSTLREFTTLSLSQPPAQQNGGNGPTHPDLIVWPESPAPFYTSDPFFRNAISSLAQQSQAWMVVGSLGTRSASDTPEQSTEIYNSASLVSPSGEWMGRYDKVHLVPFGEYLPFKRIFAFAGGLTKAVGEFTPGTSHAPLQAGTTKLGVFICYESIFPDEVRQSVTQGAQVLVNISNDGWYGDSGAYAQHLKQARMRAIENARWLLRDTNTGVTAAIDPYGRIAASIPRKIRAVLFAPYSLSSETTFYTRYGDWFAYLCAIISIVFVGWELLRLLILDRGKKHYGRRT
ncbi:MAG TPA: apolipoprotein N-acyltransferase [Terriglobales bacterium]|nr:apolipoprotein N-acyltransferase [Terriglobales bacterium]